MSFIVIADVEALLNVRDFRLLPALAALGVEIVVPRPAYNRLRPGSVGALIEAYTPPIRLVGPDDRDRHAIPVTVSYFVTGEGRRRMQAGEAGALIVPFDNPWHSPRRIGNLRSFVVDETLVDRTRAHFQDVAAEPGGPAAIIALLENAPDVPPDPGDEIE